jgi:hypothetical protein
MPLLPSSGFSPLYNFLNYPVPRNYPTSIRGTRLQGFNFIDTLENHRKSIIYKIISFADMLALRAMTETGWALVPAPVPPRFFVFSIP